MKKFLKSLSTESRQIWSNVHQEWELSKLEEIYLQQALREFDRVLQCEEKAEKEGLTLQDNNKRKYLNPLLQQAKISKNNYLRLMKLVGFEKVLKEKAGKRVGRPTDAEIYEKE